MALSEAERARRYRERRKAGEKLVRYRRPADRRSKPQQWADAVETLLNIPITGRETKQVVPLSNLVTLTRKFVPTEVTHQNIQPTIDLTMGVYGRDLGHVSDDVAKVIDGFGKRIEGEWMSWVPYDPGHPKALELLDVLFPCQNAHYWAIDRF